MVQDRKIIGLVIFRLLQLIERHTARCICVLCSHIEKKVNLSIMPRLVN
jgi:hypothetical protein